MLVTKLYAMPYTVCYSGPDIPCFLSNKKCSNSSANAANGSMSVCMLYNLVRVNCVTLYPALNVSTSSVPILGNSSSNASGVAVTILHAQ